MVDLHTLKANVFPGESGGDYNALFGYSNRPNGQFAGTNLTDMTVDEALQFSSPSGPYGQWVKNQIGRVATPMGAYQVVGSTLRDAKSGLGLTGNEQMTPDLQDQIGQWIYQAQGPGAWEGWGKGGKNMARQPQPVSGTPTMSTQGRAAPQAEEEKVPFFQRPGVGNALDSLAIALQGMTINPNQALMQLSANRIAGRRKAQQTKAQQNRTLEALKNMGAPTQIIQMAEAGYGREAMSQMAQMARGQQQDPYSSIGKLQSDLAAGRISQEQYEIALQSMAPSNTSIEVGPDGQLRFVQGPGAQAEPFTQGQSKDNVYVTRAQGALKVLDPVADELVSAASRAANVDPTGFIRSRIQSPEFQVAQQAGNEFLQAILRKDTGAAITEQEQQLYGQTYLPQPGDSPQVLTEKKAARRRALDAIRAGMSPAQLIAVERGLSQGQSSNGGGQANAPQSGGGGFSVTGVID